MITCYTCSQQSHCKIVCKACRRKHCVSCCKKYLLNTNEPMCPSCKASWSDMFLLENFPFDFLSSRYRHHRGRVLSSMQTIPGIACNGSKFLAKTHIPYSTEYILANKNGLLKPIVNALRNYYYLDQRIRPVSPPKTRDIETRYANGEYDPIKYGDLLYERERKWKFELDKMKLLRYVHREYGTILDTMTGNGAQIVTQLKRVHERGEREYANMCALYQRRSSWPRFMREISTDERTE